MSDEIKGLVIEIRQECNDMCVVLVRVPRGILREGGNIMERMVCLVREEDFDAMASQYERLLIKAGER